MPISKLINKTYGISLFLSLFLISTLLQAVSEIENLKVDYRSPTLNLSYFLPSLLSDKLIEALAAGYRIFINYKVLLYQKLKLGFNRLLFSRKYSDEIEYDIREGNFILARTVGEDTEFFFPTTIGNLNNLLGEVQNFKLTPLILDKNKFYYLIVLADFEIKASPNLAEVKSWFEEQLKEGAETVFQKIALFIFNRIKLALGGNKKYISQQFKLKP